MSRNIILSGGPGNGKMISVKDDEDAVFYCELEQNFTFSPMGCEAVSPMQGSSYLYRQSEADKNVFNYAH